MQNIIKMTTSNWNSKYFSPRELRCKHTGKLEISAVLVSKLDQLREKMGNPIVVTSGYRDRSHPVEAVKAIPGRHAQGIAVDVAISGHNKFDLIRTAMELGFNGIGINLKKGFIHLDLRAENLRTVFDY